MLLLRHLYSSSLQDECDQGSPQLHVCNYWLFTISLHTYSLHLYETLNFYASFCFANLPYAFSILDFSNPLSLLLDNCDEILTSNKKSDKNINIKFGLNDLVNRRGVHILQRQNHCFLTDNSL